MPHLYTDLCHEKKADVFIVPDKVEILLISFSKNPIITISRLRICEAKLSFCFPAVLSHFRTSGINLSPPHTIIKGSTWYGPSAQAALCPFVYNRWVASVSVYIREKV